MSGQACAGADAYRQRVLAGRACAGEAPQIENRLLRPVDRTGLAAVVAPRGDDPTSW